MDAIVTIGVPSGPTWSARFAKSLLGVVGYSAGQGIITQLVNIRGSILPQQRRKVVQGAMAQKSTHLLFVDADQVFPPETVVQLLSHKKPVVACNVATKKHPSEPTARQSDGSKGGVPVYTLQSSSGLEKVWRIGTGVMLLDLKVFEHMPQPWFEVTWNKKHRQEMGEDWNFCRKLQAQGIPIFIDHDLSKKIGHVGEYVFTHDDVEMGLQLEAIQNGPSIQQNCGPNATAPSAGQLPSLEQLLAKEPKGSQGPVKKMAAGD